MNAAGGYAGTASLCGALGVAAAFIGTVTDRDTQKKVVGELWKWYGGATLPMYNPGNMTLATTVADSPLCIDSVGKFMEVQKCAYGDPERKERCARVTADVTRKTVELLNSLA